MTTDNVSISSNHLKLAGPRRFARAIALMYIPSTAEMLSKTPQVQQDSTIGLYLPMSNQVERPPTASRQAEMKNSTAALACAEPIGNAAMHRLRSIYAPGFQLAKVSMMLLDLVPETFVQTDLNWESAPNALRDRAKLLKAMDQVNDRFGKRTVLLGSSGLN